MPRRPPQPPRTDPALDDDDDDAPDAPRPFGRFGPAMDDWDRLQALGGAATQDELQQAAIARYQKVVERERKRTLVHHFPPPDRRGEKPTVTQRALLQRIHACPVPVYWGGMLFRTCHASGIPYAPEFNPATVGPLWRKGLLERAPRLMHEDGEGMRDDWHIRVSDLGKKHLVEDEVARERLRWRAIQEISAEIGEAFARYRDHDGERNGGWRTGMERPPGQTRLADIEARMREIEQRGR